MQQKLYHGAAFYPELWENETIEQDIKTMKEIGINVVRIGEFAWHHMEPEENRINIDFFIKIIKKLYENGIETIMCTPTVTPPIWLSYEHQECMHVDENGKVMSHGSRQHFCTNNQYFRERSRIITDHVAKAVGKLPGIAAWQLDNEFKSHVSECMCETCKKEWHKWLQKKYGTIESLNKAWGAEIWSEAYNNFEQVPQPVATSFHHNSSLSTMYKIFSMEKIAEFAEEQAEIIRKYSTAPITHNSCLGFKVNNERLFRSLDFAGVDGYAGYKHFLIKFDLWRNIKKGRSFWVMETSTSHGGSIMGAKAPHPNGYLKAEAVAAYALGAQGFCYWLWRQQKSGCEQLHGAILSTWGKPTIGYANVLEVRKALEELEAILMTTKVAQAELAVTYSDIARVFLYTEPCKNIDYRGLLTQFNTRIVELGIHRDLIIESDTLDGYKLLCTPFMHYVSAEYLNRAERFVEDGGIWIVGPLTGGRTEHHTMHTNAALGDIEELAGIETLFTYPMDGTGAKGQAFDTTAPLGMWSSVFKSNGAKIIGKIEGGVTPGAAFLTEHKLGKGKIVMLGSMPMGEEGDMMIKKIINHYSEEAGITLRMKVSNGTIVVPRKGDDCGLWIIINMDGKGGSIYIPEDGVDMITEKTILKGNLEIGKYEYRVVRFYNK